MRKISKFVFIGLLFLLFISEVKAVGLAVAPINIEFLNAVAGKEYERMLVLYSYYDEDVILSLSATGDCEDWIQFYPFEGTDSITKIIAPAKDSVKLLVKFLVPEDATEGTHTCTIFAQRTPEEGSGTTFGVRVRSSVKIIVTDGQASTTTIESVTTIVTETDTETTQPETTTVPTTTEATSTTVEESITTTVVDTGIPTGQFISIDPESPIFIVLIIIVAVIIGILIKHFKH